MGIEFGTIVSPANKVGNLVLEVLMVTFPVYIVPAARVADIECVKYAEENPAFLGISEHLNSPEFKVSSAEDLAEVGWYISRCIYRDEHNGHACLDREDYLDTAENIMVMGFSQPGEDHGGGARVFLDDILEEAIELLRGHLETRSHSV